ncbi:MAG: ThiF family adenylyltransferase [Chloroflexota bacterium]|nr:ThiF family adenylyltransferase [Chloroflexota bacterium]
MVAQEHFDKESLTGFVAELKTSGFSPVEGSALRRWRGPIHPAFKELTDAATMDIAIMPGWPFQPPALVVQGLNTNHSTLGGFVCLWQDGDFSLEWTTVAGLFSRIEEWCENVRLGWEGQDLGRDALLNFKDKYAYAAIFDLPALDIRKGSWGDCRASVKPYPVRVDILPGRRQAANELRAMWFHAGQLKSPPPRQLSEVFSSLPRSQCKGLEKALSERRNPRDLVASGGVDIILFCWEWNGRTDLLVMACKGTGETVEAIALQPGPNDEKTLILRAGPDAPELVKRKAVVLGAGALGGHTALTLAESGLGSIEIVDHDVLLPGNVVRHVAGHRQVGKRKVEAVRAVIADHAPWTKVSVYEKLAPVRTPDEVREIVMDADVIVDATGSETLAYSLAMVAESEEKALVSGALYRGGFVGRVQRQALPGDTPIHQRGDQSRYPSIPPGDESEEFAIPQLGCSAPVNNAPPSAVLACASTIVQVAVDTLVGRYEFPDEVIDVYRAIPEPPFNRLGRLSVAA